jgi:hypothetical protein
MRMNPKQPENTVNTWMHYMRRGEFEKAWERSDEVLRSCAGQPCWHLLRHEQYIWDGTPLQGKRVLIRCYHGLGDTIQFIRYMPLVKNLAAEVMVWAQPPLLPLLEKVPGIDQLMPLHDGTPEAEYEVDVEIMELPHIFRTTLDAIPGPVPYLQAEPMPLATGKEALAVGLVWRAGDWDEHRSIPFSCLTPLDQAEGIQLYILQQNAAAAGWEEGFGLHPGEYSLADYARVIKGLDLLITVDSMPAHLAGALGVPVWTLLHAGADWRWMENRHDSPWYPTMRLFRQTHPGDWAGVIGQVKTELEKVAQRGIRV